jgi:hypothetical protein
MSDADGTGAGNTDPVDTDPVDDTAADRDLSFAHDEGGDAAAAAGDLAAARVHYQAAIDIVQRLADAEPDNPGWRRDLDFSRMRLASTPGPEGDAPDRHPGDLRKTSERPVRVRTARRTGIASRCSRRSLANRPGTAHRRSRWLAR